MLLWVRAATDEQIERVQQAIESKPGYKAPVWRGEERSVVGVIGSIYPELQSELELLPGVVQVLRVSKPYKLAGREFHPDDTRITVGET